MDSPLDPELKGEGKPSIGVLITYFNEGELLRECLDSLRGQMAHEDEILIYDDCSSDPAERYLPKGLPVRVLRGTVNQGAPHGRNVLLNACRCDYVHFHDADDFFLPQWCQRVRQAIRDTEAEIVLTEDSLYEGDRITKVRWAQLDRLNVSLDLLRFCLNGMLAPLCVTVKRRLALSVGGIRELFRRGPLDWDFHVRIAATGASFAVIDQPLVVKRVLPGRDSSDVVKHCTVGVELAKLLKGDLPPKYHTDLAEGLVNSGLLLLRRGARQKAREAFQMVEELGLPPSVKRRRLYGRMAKSFGFELTERLGSLYRKLLPQPWRASFAKKGW